MDIFENEKYYLNYFNFHSEAAAYFRDHRIKRWKGNRIPTLHNRELFLFEKHMMGYCIYYKQPYDPDLVGYIEITYMDGVTETCWYNRLFRNPIEEYENYDYAREENRYCAQLFEDSIKKVIGNVDEHNLQSIRQAIKRVSAFQSKCDPYDWENYNGKSYLGKLMNAEDALLTVNGVKYGSIEERDKARERFDKVSSDVGNYFMSIFKGDMALADMLVKEFNNDDQKYFAMRFKLDSYLSDKNAACISEALEKTRSKYDIKDISNDFVEACNYFVKSCDYLSTLDIRRYSLIKLSQLAGLIILILALITFQVLLFTKLHFGFIIETLIHFVIIIIYTFVYASEIISTIYNDFESHILEYRTYKKNNERDNERDNKRL